MPSARIRRLTLTNFRSYRSAQVDAGAGLIVLTGPNGAGKTNLIEAISFLTPGRGLRRATLDEVAFDEGEAAVLKLADPGSPTLIQDRDTKGALYVLMPMRV